MPLVLDLVRHGEAEPAGAGGDRARRLTASGISSVGSLAARLVASGSTPTRVFSSPRERAVHSARILAAFISPDPGLELIDELEPGGDPTAVLAALTERGVVSGHAMLVGHLPLLDHLYQLLTGAEGAFPVASLHRIVFVGGAQSWHGRQVLSLRS